MPVATLEIDPNDGRITLMSVRARVHATFARLHNTFPVLIFPSHPSGERPIPRCRHQLQRSVPVGREQARGKVAAGETPPTLHTRPPKTKLKTCIHKPLQRHKNWSSGGDCRITAVSCSVDGKCAPLPHPLQQNRFSVPNAAPADTSAYSASAVPTACCGPQTPGCACGS